MSLGKTKYTLFRQLNGLYLLPFLAVVVFIAELPTINRLIGVAFLLWGYVFIAVCLTLALVAILVPRLRVTLGIAAGVLCLSFVAPAGGDAWRNRPISGAKYSPPLKIITYNWLANGRNRSEAFAWLRAQQPDIVAIQEFDRREPGAEAGLYSLFPYHTEVKDRNDIVILSKFPIRADSTSAFYDRTVVTCIVTIDGRPLRIYGLHAETLRTNSELSLRNAYLGSIAEHIDRKAPHVLVLGDLNTTRWDPYYRVLVSKARLHEQPTLFPSSTRIAVRSGLPFIGSPIDHILTNGHNRLSDCHTGPSMGSDHLPVVCRLYLRDGGNV